MGWCKRGVRARSEGRLHPGGARAALVLLILVVVAACSADSGNLGGVGGASGVEASQAQTPQNSASKMTPGLRAAYIASVQNNASEEYRFERPSGTGRAIASNPAQGLTAELADGALRVEPDADEPDWSLGLRWTGIGRGDDIEPVESPVVGSEAIDNLATYHRPDGSEEWYLNGPLRIEQGFLLAESGTAGSKLVRFQRSTDGHGPCG